MANDDDTQDSLSIVLTAVSVSCFYVVNGQAVDNKPGIEFIMFC